MSVFKKGNWMGDSDKWSVLKILEPEFVAQCVGVSESSIRRYLVGKRRPAEDVARRLDHLAAIVEEIRWSWTTEGVRRWFFRPRIAFLDGRSPAQILQGGKWNPDDPELQVLLSLAISGRSSDAT